MAERDIVGNYLGLNSKKRMDYIYKNYRNFKDISDAYMDSVTEMIASMREYERRHSREDLGVRIQTSQSMSSITEERAYEHLLIKEALDKNLVTESLVGDKLEREMVSMPYLNGTLCRASLKSSVNR